MTGSALFHFSATKLVELRQRRFVLSSVEGRALAMPKPENDLPQTVLRQAQDERGGASPLTTWEPATDPSAHGEPVEPSTQQKPRLSHASFDRLRMSGGGASPLTTWEPATDPSARGEPVEPYTQQKPRLSHASFDRLRMSGAGRLAWKKARGWKRSLKPC